MLSREHIRFQAIQFLVFLQCQSSKFLGGHDLNQYAFRSTDPPVHLCAIGIYGVNG